MSWILKISSQAREDLDYFRAHDREIYRNCYLITKAIEEDPYSGPGKPLRINELVGEVWFRRTSLEDRAVYEVFGKTVKIAAYRTHIE